MTTSVYDGRRKILFEIRNTLFRRRETLRKATFNNTSADYEDNLRELKRVEAALEQMRRGVYGICRESGTLIPAEQLLADPLLAFVD
jgi:RNA polymerase-binding transcription factor DksA